MIDQTHHAHRPQGQRIGLVEDHEVLNWCQTLGVTEEQLRVAIAAVGDDAEEVRSHLGRAN